MPVVELNINRIRKLVSGTVTRKQILDVLPFLGLDIESEDNDEIRIEYSPNRPDYSTDYGIANGLQGLLGIKKGIQKISIKKKGQFAIKVDSSVTKIKFWPTFFPYTEPSLQTMVYNEKLGKWIELFGMGIFRPEVTKPLGIDKPVLAWGGGIERIAMLKYELDDVREFYNNNLSWLRSA